MVLLASSVVNALHLCPHLYTNQLVTGHGGLEMLLFFVLEGVLTYFCFNFDKTIKNNISFRIPCYARYEDEKYTNCVKMENLL